MRHSIAEARVTTDFDRQLTPEGIRKADLLAEIMVQDGFSPGAIVHSPLVRSRQTAHAFSRLLPETPVFELSEVVSANWSLLQALGAAGWTDPLVIGHNPGISMLASKLSTKEAPLFFHTCSFAHFEVDALPPQESRLVQWLQRPPSQA